MATLLKDSEGRSPYWICAYTGTDGRRLKKSTKVRFAPLKTDTKTASQLRDEAMGVCVKWSQLAEAGKNRTISEAQTRRVVAEIYEQSTGEALHFQTSQQWLENWLASKVGTAAEGTLVKYKQVIDEFIEHLAHKASKPLGLISPADVLGFQNWLRDRHLAPPTINLAIKKTLNAPFAEAHKLGYIPVNPVAAVKFLRDDSDAVRDVFTQEHLKLLLAEARNSDWEGAILCGLTTGLRLGDIASLTWGMVDFPQRLLRLRAKKNQKMMTLPLHPEFLRWLELRPHGHGKTPIFSDLFGKKAGGCNGLSAQFRKLMDRANVHGRVIRSGEGGGHRTTSLSFHSFRHTFTSMMANAGIHPDVRQKLTGHSSVDVHKIYSHHEIETMRNAVEALKIVSSDA